MNSFEKIIGANPENLRETRVKNTVRNAETCSRKIVDDKKQSFRDMQMQMEDLLDLGATNTQDIATHLKGFDSVNFTKQVHDLSLKMACKAREIAVAVNVHNKLFPENKVENLDKDDLSILEGISF